MHRYAGIAALTLVGLTTPVNVQARDAHGCLRWTDIDTMTRHGPDSVLVKSLSKGAYVIKFTGPCDYQRTPGDYFVMRVQDRQSCISSLDVFHIHNGGACFIESITPVANP